MSDAEEAVRAPGNLPAKGLTCQSCENRIDRAFSSLDGIVSVEVRRDHGQIDLWPRPGADEATVRQAAAARLAELGYAAGDTGDDARGLRIVVVVALAAVAVAAGFWLFTRIQGAYLGGGVVADPRELFGAGSIAALAASFGFGLVVGFSPVTLAAAPVAMGYATRDAPPAGDAHCSSLPRPPPGWSPSA